eukprot:TRINITY_DN15204_c0_g1_i4.p2 TRINITY_DN15204_c0_g1~~TRINITY_DN15204_c0_g1_i4.p2  ORF type:complete len:113 (-),score=9.56 TRINITY_DN15204_c0_g1_i4:130-468(-)
MMSQRAEQEDSWIECFCNVRGNEIFVSVDRSWIEDQFNLYGLESLSQLSYFEQALDLILDREMEGMSEQMDEIEKAAMHLYGLIHARYIVTEPNRWGLLRNHISASFPPRKS